MTERVTCEGMLQVVPVLVLRATKMEELVVSAFIRTNDWRYYCIDAEVVHFVWRQHKIGIHSGCIV